MKNKKGYGNFKFAGHLRFSIDKSLSFLKVAFYLLLAIVGFLVTITTNANSIRFDTNNSEVYKHSYRVETSDALVKKLSTKESVIYDFTKPLPSNSLLDEYDFDCALILNETLNDNEVIFGLPKSKNDSNLDNIDIYIPNFNNNYKVIKTFTSKDLTYKTLFLAPNVYKIYNKAYESIKNGNLILNNNSLNLLSYGRLSKEKLDADIYCNINDETLKQFIKTDSYDIGSVGTVTFNLNNINYALTVKLVETKTTYNFESFANFDISIGKTIVFKEIRDSFMARQKLLKLEDKYESFNSTYLNGNEYDTTYYTIGSFVLIGVYVVLITSIMLCASKSHKNIKKLSKLGMDSNLLIKQYAISTIIISVISILFTYMIAFIVPTIFEKYGSILWLNAFDFIMIFMVEIIVCLLDIFVASRSVL